MAYHKMISRRLFKQISNAPSPFPTHLSRRLLYASPHKPVQIQVPVPPDRFPSLPVSDQLVDQILEQQNRFRLDSFYQSKEKKQTQTNGITINDVKKVVRAAQMEAVRERFISANRSCVSYNELLNVCEEINGGEGERASDLASTMDESGAIIVLGDVVFLDPQMVMKAIKNMIPPSIAKKNDTSKNELKQMERKKACIDAKAKASVRKELWCGLGLLAIQTVGFMRLTFWELSWDVMEPICFFVTSIYFMAGYAFFLRTSRDPSFEGVFESRFASKQKRLMRRHNFDLELYNRLKRDSRENVLDRLTDISSQFGHQNSLIGHSCDR